MIFGLDIMVNSGVVFFFWKVCSCRCGVFNGWGKMKFIGCFFVEVGGCVV